MRRKTRASHRLNALRSADTPALQERRVSQTPQGQHALNATHLKQFENAYSETNRRRSEEPDECGNRKNKKQDSQFANVLKQNG
jgi:hypothetical protein